MTKNSLILGLGSEILRDDGLPVKLVNELKQNKLFKNCDLKTANITGIDLLDQIVGYKTVIIIDTMKTRQGIPGNVILVDANSLKATMHLTEFHNVSLQTVMSLGRMLEYRLPEKINIIAIEIVEDKIFTSELSHRLLKQFDSIVGKVVELIKRILREKTKPKQTTNK